jgi:tRNA U34 2-thiouridine synthase MnmA/TrmU
MKKIKALVLFSGGLDSLIAVDLLKKQNIEVTALNFESYFFNATRAKKVAQQNKLPIKIVNLAKKHLAMIKQPVYGYGKAANPCIDCHLMMLREAKKIMNKEKYDFIATGEVLGQRPMSQNLRALNLIAEKSDLKGCLLRPLSAKNLAISEPEKNNLIQREKLLNIKGRSRKQQLLIAQRYKLKGFDAPAGGCLLTEKEFAKKLKELFKIFPECDGNDVTTLKYGRHSWKNKTKIIIGRNQPENEQLNKLARANDIIIEMKNYNGPTTLIRNYTHQKIPQAVIIKAQKLTQNYATQAKDKNDVAFDINAVI